MPSVVLNNWVAPQLALRPLPGDPPTLGRFDAVASGRFSPRVATAADVLLVVTLAAAPLISLVDGHWAARAAEHRRGRAFVSRWRTAVLIEAEALALTALLTTVMKFAVGRPRPYTSLTAADVGSRDREALEDDLQSPDRSHSFPSGHTALAFAAATSLATTLTLDAPHTKRARVTLGLTWSLALLAAGTTAALRVVAGKHYPSDVIAGAALGSAIGVATPLAHTRWSARGRHRASRSRSRPRGSS